MRIDHRERRADHFFFVDSARMRNSFHQHGLDGAQLAVIGPIRTRPLLARSSNRVESEIEEFAAIRNDHIMAVHAAA